MQIKNIIIISVMIGILMSGFSFAQNEENLTIEEKNETEKGIFAKIIEKIWKEKIVSFWQKIYDWLKENIWLKIKNWTKNQIEKTKNFLKERLNQQKEEIKEEIKEGIKEEVPKLKESLWERFKKLIKQ